MLDLSKAQRVIKIQIKSNNTGHISVNTTGISLELLLKLLAFYKCSITLCAEKRKIVVFFFFPVLFIYLATCKL